MPTTREILDLLTPDELAHLNQRHGIKVDRRTKAHLLDRLEEKGPDLATLLSDLRRPRLAELCGQLGLSDGPKDTWALVTRLSAAASTTPAPREREAPPALGPDGSSKKKDRTMQLTLDDANASEGRAGKIESASGTPKPRMTSSPPPASDRTLSWIVSFIASVGDEL